MIKMQYQGAKQRIAKQRIENKELIQRIDTKNSNKIWKQSLQIKYPKKGEI